MSIQTSTSEHVMCVYTYMEIPWYFYKLIEFIQMESSIIKI